MNGITDPLLPPQGVCADDESCVIDHTDSMFPNGTKSCSETNTGIVKTPIIYN